MNTNYKLYPAAEGNIKSSTDYAPSTPYATKETPEYLRKQSTSKYSPPNIKNKHLLLTQKTHTPEEIEQLIKTYTVIAPYKDYYILKDKTSRHTIHPTPDKKAIDKLLPMLQYNKPASLTLEVTEYKPYSGLIYYLATHNCSIQFTDISLNTSFTIYKDSNTTPTISQNYLEYFQEQLKPYTKLLKQLKQEEQFNKLKLPQPISPEIIQYINIWAPAYQIDIPQAPQTYTDILAITNYTTDIMSLYQQLKAYERYDIPVDNDNTICPKCHLPYNYTEEFCPHCDYSDFENFLELED